MAVEIIDPTEQFFDNSGNPLNGGLIYCYDVGTTTLRAIYSDTGLSVSAANPIVLDSAGRTDMRYTATGSFKLVGKTSAGVQLWARDGIDGRVPIGSGALAIANGGTGATTAGAALTNLGAASSADLAAQAAELAALSGTLSSSEKTHLATGTTAQRPLAPIEGDVRRNTTLTFFEGYTGSAWRDFVTATSGFSATAPTYQKLTSGSGATYTTPAGVKWIRVKAVGGGGGGGGSGGAPTVGGTTIFNSIQAAGGSAGGNYSGGTGGAGGAGGTGGTGTATLRINGSAGGTGPSVGGGSVSAGVGAPGGNSPFFAGGGGTNGGVGGTNTGGGGGGRAGTAGTDGGAGGGGSGEYFELIINSPAATYTYTIGASGTAGTGGGAGGTGCIVVEEYYV